MRRSSRRSPYETFGLMTLALAIIIGAAVYVSAGAQWHPYFIWIATLSVITFFWYGFDKGQSKRRGLRVPELILHLLALLGGFPGGWLGRLAFRNKTQKGTFTLVLIASTILHAGLAPSILAA